MPSLISVATAAWSGVLFVVAGNPDDRRCFSVDMNTLEVEERFRWGDLPGYGPSSVSADNRWGVTSEHAIFLTEDFLGSHPVQMSVK